MGDAGLGEFLGIGAENPGARRKSSVRSLESLADRLRGLEDVAEGEPAGVEAAAVRELRRSLETEIDRLKSGDAISREALLKTIESHSGVTTLKALAILSSTLLMVWALPACFILYALDPASYPRAIRISVFLMSIGSAIAFYIAHPSQFPTMADKVTFFTGVGLGPATVVSFFIDE